MKLKKIVLVRYGEIILKGYNRPVFEDALVKNIRAAIKEAGEVNITRAQATIYIEPMVSDDQADVIVAKLKKVFGIVSIVVAYKAEKTIDAAFDEIKESFDDILKSKSTFKVEAKRADKKFPLKSPEICAEIGGRILANRGTENNGRKITLSNCYVIEPPADSLEDIFELYSKIRAVFFGRTTYLE